jgi:hypothetical protein
MVEANKQYAVLSSNFAVPLDKLEALLTEMIPLDYNYDKDIMYFAKRSGISDLKLISGEALIANEVADRMKEKK